MSATLKDLTSKDLATHPDRRSTLYFKPRGDRQEWKVQAGPRRGPGRTVVKRYEPPDGATWQAYTRHMAADVRFVRADDRWYLSIEPTYYFTSNGRDEFAFASQQLAIIKQHEGHEAIRSQTLFWARYLTGRSDLFGAGNDPRMRFGALARVDVDRGIDDKSWKPLTVEEIELVSDDGAPTLFDVQEEL